MEKIEKLNSGETYIVENRYGLTSAKVIKSTEKCYLVKLKDSEESQWFRKDDFHSEYDVIECLGYVEIKQLWKTGR